MDASFFFFDASITKSTDICLSVDLMRANIFFVEKEVLCVYRFPYQRMTRLAMPAWHASAWRMISAQALASLAAS